MRITRLLLIAILFGLVGSAASVQRLEAQGTAESLLARARALLDATEPESAVALLRQLLALNAAPALRREAELRLATASWSLGLLDSAAVHFQAVVREDPFLQLDPDLDNPELVTALRVARRSVIAVGVRPSPDTLVDPRTGRWQVAVAVSQPGQVRVRLGRSDARTDARSARLAVDSSATVVFPVAGADSVTLAPGTYRLVVDYSGPAGATASSVATLEIAWSTPDTLAYEPPPPDSLFRLEFRVGPRSRGLMLRSVGVGVSAAAMPMLLGHDQLRTSGTKARALFIGATISVAGLAAYVLARPRQLLPENIEYNRALRSAWAARNGVIATTNATRRGTPMVRVRVVPAP